jgi:hypothetical protein
MSNPSGFVDNENYFTTLINRLGLEAGDPVRTLFIRFNQGASIRVLKYLGDSTFSYVFYPARGEQGEPNCWCFKREENDNLSVTNVSKMFNLVHPYDPFYSPNGHEILVNVESIYEDD